MNLFIPICNLCNLVRINEILWDLKNLTILPGKQGQRLEGGGCWHGAGSRKYYPTAFLKINWCFKIPWFSGRRRPLKILILQLLNNLYLSQWSTWLASLGSGKVFPSRPAQAKCLIHVLCPGLTCATPSRALLLSRYPREQYQCFLQCPTFASRRTTSWVSVPHWS